MAATASTKMRLPLSRRYDFKKPIGSGGMGTVYRAHDRERGTDVAIKVLRYKTSESPILHQRIAREFRAASELEHPNIVRALSFETIDDINFLVYELVEGGSVEDVLERRKRLSETESVQIVTQIAQALEYAHSRGVIHRDVKPDNILLLPDGRAKLTDFGLAKMIDSGDDNLTRPASGLGTPQFMAPEQFADAKGVTHRCDIYSLGATLYNLLTGQPPFDGKTALAIMTQKEFEKYTPARRLVSGLSERVDAAITAALKPDPLDRPESCLAFFKLITSRTKAHKAPHRTVPQQENGSNRRAWIRHDVGIGSAGSIDTGLHSGGEIETWPLVVRDVSKGGIGLLLARRFESGTELLIEFGEGAPERRRLTAKVIRVQGEKAGHWFHGCRFESPLNEDELKKLVEASTD